MLSEKPTGVSSQAIYPLPQARLLSVSASQETWPIMMASVFLKPLRQLDCTKFCLAVGVSAGIKSVLVLRIAHMVYLDRLQKRPGCSRSLSRWFRLAPGVGGRSMSRRQKTDGRGLECIDQNRGAIVVHGYTALGPRGNHWIDGSSWPQLAVSIRGCQPQHHTSPAVRRTCLIKRSTSAIGLLCRSSVTATAEDPTIFSRCTMKSMLLYLPQIMPSSRVSDGEDSLWTTSMGEILGHPMKRSRLHIAPHLPSHCEF